MVVGGLVCVVCGYLIYGCLWMFCLNFFLVFVLGLFSFGLQAFRCGFDGFGHWMFICRLFVGFVLMDYLLVIGHLGLF